MTAHRTDPELACALLCPAALPTLPLPELHLHTTPIERPAFILGFLARAGQGEIVVRRAGQTAERRVYPLARCACGGLCDPGDGQCISCQERR